MSSAVRSGGGFPFFGGDLKDEEFGSLREYADKDDSSATSKMSVKVKTTKFDESLIGNNDFSVFDDIDTSHFRVADGGLFSGRNRSGSISSFTSALRDRSDSISSFVGDVGRDRSCSILSTGSIFTALRNRGVSFDVFPELPMRHRSFSVEFSMLPASIIEGVHSLNNDNNKVGGVIGSELSTEDVGRSLNSNHIETKKQRKPYGGKRPRTIFAPLKRLAETKALIQGVSRNVVALYSNDDSEDDGGEFEANAEKLIMHNPNLSLLVSSLCKPRMIGNYTPEQRRVRLTKFLEKREKRVWKKKVKYGCRKKLADSRPRVKGRFVPRAVQEQVLETASDEMAIRNFGSPAINNNICKQGTVPPPPTLSAEPPKRHPVYIATTVQKKLAPILDSLATK